MAINFTPEMKEYTNQGKFRYWVQMILPTIYDDSLSYMELLNKVVYVLNLAIEDVDTVEENVAALLTAFNELQSYTNDYFDNLDVQEEINNKLDDMVSDGTFTNILQPLIQDYQEQLNLLEARVDNLTSVITPGSTSADAELVDIRTAFNSENYANAGTAVRTQAGGLYELSNAYSKEQADLFMLLGFNMMDISNITTGKYLNYQTGNESTNPNYFYTDYIGVADNMPLYHNFVNAHICYYDYTKKFISGLLISNATPNHIEPPTNTRYIRVSTVYTSITNYRLGYTPINVGVQVGSSNLTQELETYLHYIGRLINNNIYTNLADLPKNTIVAIAYNFPDRPANIIPGNDDVIITTGGTYPVQLYVSRYGIYKRIYTTTYQKWFSVNAPIFANPSNLIEILKLYNGTRAKIILEPGIYNLHDMYQQFYGSEFWVNYNGYNNVVDPFYRGLWLEDIELIGSGDCVITFEYEDDKTTPIMRDFSLIALAGDVHISNCVLDIGHRRLRYAIHDDFTSSHPNQSHITYDNLILRGTGVSPGLIGGGTSGKGSVYIISDCVFEDNQNERDLFYHNYINSEHPDRIVVKNCYGLKDCVFLAYGQSTLISECLVNNSKFRNIYTTKQTEDSADNMHLIAWLCETN